MFPYRRRYYYRRANTIFSLDSPTLDKDQRENTRPISNNISSTGITNSVRKNETKSPVVVVETTKITTEKNEGEDKISFAESQFYARTTSTHLLQND